MDGLSRCYYQFEENGFRAIRILNQTSDSYMDLYPVHKEIASKCAGESGAGLE